MSYKKISNDNKKSTKFIVKDIPAYFLVETNEDIEQEVINTLKNNPLTDEEKKKKLDICEKIANFEQEYINIFGCK